MSKVYIIGAVGFRDGRSSTECPIAPCTLAPGARLGPPGWGPLKPPESGPAAKIPDLDPNTIRPCHRRDQYGPSPACDYNNREES